MKATAVVTGMGDPALSGATNPVPWWSFTKTTLATASLHLVDQGALNLAEHVNGHRFTLRYLLRHEAAFLGCGGIARYHEDMAAGNRPSYAEVARSSKFSLSTC